jgi:CBS domain-containing membrane protein
MRLKYTEDFYIRSLLNKVTVKEVMTSPVISVNLDSPFREIVKILQEQRIRHVPIINAIHEVVGIMSQRDLYKLQPPHKNEDGVWVYDYDMIDGFVLNQVMTQNPLTLSLETPVAQAIAVMVRNKYGCIPIVDAKKKLCGIITQFDILKIAFDILQEGQPQK